MYARQAKSKDIDLVVDFEERGRLRTAYDIEKNDRLRKYEIKAEGFDVDVSVPHWSTTLALDIRSLVPLTSRDRFAAEIEGAGPAVRMAEPSALFDRFAQEAAREKRRTLPGGGRPG